MRSPSKIYLEPNPEQLLESSRSFGYSLETAIADLIDNSISANASCIIIDFIFNEQNSFVRIEDNGHGMTMKSLLNAMRFGSSNPNLKRSLTDLGRFGLGLKTASFSQCRRLTVYTKDQNLNPSVACWDLDLVSQKKKWLLLTDFKNSSSKKNVGELSERKSGTIVLWENIDKIIEEDKQGNKKEHFYRKIQKVHTHLGLVYHRLIEEEKLKILINTNEVNPINPFHISTEVDTLELQEENLFIKNSRVVIQPFVLPHESKYSNQDSINRELIRGYNAHQGIYLYRNSRLIIDGSWLDLEIRAKESQRLSRISISIDNSIDHEWQIEVQKSKAKIPDILRKDIKKICIKSLERAVKIYSFRGAYIKKVNPESKIEFTWLTKSKKGQREYEINRNHFLYKRIKQLLQHDSLIFEEFVKIIEQSIPIGMIVNDFSDHNLLIKDVSSESIKQTKSMFDSLFKTLIATGISEEDAKKDLMNLDIFQSLIRHGDTL